MTTKQQTAEALEFAFVVAREFPEATAAQVVELLRLARRHGRLQERACNEQIARRGFDRATEVRIAAVCAAIGFPAVRFEGDPRGFTVKVTLPSGRSNHWGGETWGVPQ